MRMLHIDINLDKLENLIANLLITVIGCGSLVVIAKSVIDWLMYV